MISKDIDIGRIIVTDAAFGHVTAGDKKMTKRFGTLGIKTKDITAMTQVHGSHIEYAGGSGIQLMDGTDGLWTNKPKILIYTKTADCVPILLWSKKEEIIVALHCGWRGFLAGIIQSFSSLCQEQVWDHQTFQAFLGPHLRERHFEVQQDFIDLLPKEKTHLLKKRGKKQHFAMTQGVMETLSCIGIDQVEDCEIDTFDNPEYFSYRSWSQLPDEKRGERYSTFASAILMSL
ncbi:MAG: polyphenol oxidase family protein [bacterium]|nr:polyphenol oxidase family protein [bacterium]